MIKKYSYWFAGISLFFLPLIHAWLAYPLNLEGFYTNYSALGGILPWSDASSYYNGAINLLEKGSLNYWNIRRPLNATLFSVRLWLTNNNFQLALMIQAVWCGISCLLVTSSINKTFGKIPAIITLIILFLFASLFIPTTMSETLGFTIGCLAFVILLEAISIKNHWLFFTAGLTLTIGLNTRAGAFFILPILIFWLVYNFRKYSISFILGIISGFIFNFMLIKLYTIGTIEAPHANFAPTIFGLISGGKGWHYAYDIYPEIASRSEAEFAKYLYTESFNIFKNNPFMLLQGLARSYLGFIKGTIGFFQWWLLSSNKLMLKIIIRFCGSITLLFGIYRWWQINNLYRKSQCNEQLKNKLKLINISIIGILISTGIIWTDGGLRVFAVTIPILAVACGLAFGYYPKLSILTNQKLKLLNNNLNLEAKTAIIFSYILLALGLIGPAVIKFISSEPKIIPNFSCNPTETKMIVKNISQAPTINLPLYAKRLENHLLKNPIENQDFLKLLKTKMSNTPMILSMLYDLNSANSNYILGDKELFSNKNTYVGLCVANIPEIENIMQIKSLKEILNEK